ncbi:NADPH:quinone reductase-like Zn-dependent oxidoreductase [Pedobacter cryoconitis]|uniref:NADPH:quinone reductase-like Zn-dependent oxidoreductase n=1 Tax=Pedobacter cryoconitis TaxID=188932 RepID=A0A7W8ZRW8_9SPHI|nr:NADP-dependent oxidoreductase [Pedobacter cryoconitis]MBB5638732.1 NADPH:quinone reductase-like Zn-dependent oxidoreductase [Pedobacter cryoconitis]MBB6270256.1 NADPH:quinone reductase-like Zn-dependent oxidoreductase [Pedobacter cryoconitis]
MKAIAVKAFKDVPELIEILKPEIKPGHILIKLKTAGLNPMDWRIADGMLDGKMPHIFPLILGADGAGVVEEIGEDVSRFKTGDKVYGQMMHAPVGEGTYAEYIVVPEKVIIAKMPPGLSFEQAAASPVAGMTAFQLVKELGLSKEKTLLIVGATGGVGTFTTIFAALNGIKVLATARGEAAKSSIKKAGASETFDYSTGDLVQQIKTAYPEGVDALIDLASNPEAFDQLSSVVKAGGIALTTIGAADAGKLEAKNIRGGNFEVKGSVALLEGVSAMMEAGNIEIPVQKISLSEAPDAIAKSKTGTALGKTVIVI